MVPASTRESTIAEACCDSHASICWTTSPSVAAGSAGRFAVASSVFNRSSPVDVLRQLDKERDQARRSQERADHDQTAAAIDPPAAFAPPQPRARSRSLKGPSVATAMTANRIESVRSTGTSRMRRRPRRTPPDQHAPADGGQAARPARHLRGQGGGRPDVQVVSTAIVVAAKSVGFLRARPWRLRSDRRPGGPGDPQGSPRRISAGPGGLAVTAPDSRDAGTTRTELGPACPRRLRLATHPAGSTSTGPSSRLPGYRWKSAEFAESLKHSTRAPYVLLIMGLRLGDHADRDPEAGAALERRHQRALADRRVAREPARPIPR